ncbi:unnamed protein product [Rhodiola kirilowii]
MVALLLDKATYEKIVIVGSEDEKRQLIDEVGADILPEIYGGKAKLIALQDFQLTPHEVQLCRDLVENTGQNGKSPQKKYF